MIETENQSAPFPGPAGCVALFDLDGTLTWHDTLIGFLAGYGMRHPARWLGLWRLGPAFLRFTLARDRGSLKSSVIRIIMGGDSRTAIDAWADYYVAGLQRGRVFRPAALAALEAHRSAGDHLILLSASPDLYVPRIGRLLGFERTLCTEVKWTPNGLNGDRLDGALRTANRRGEEKSRCLEWLRTQYAGLSFVAYGNSASDLPHLKKADRALLVNAGAAARRAAVACGIGTADWK